jgi:hypothetical protein
VKKLLIAISILTLMAPAYATDIQGAGNAVMFSDLMTDVYAEVAGFVSTGARYKVVDSALVENRIDWACREISNLGLIERETTITISADTESYELPTDFNLIAPGIGRVAALSSVGLEISMVPITTEQVGNHRDDTGLPSFYRVENRKLHIEPVRDSGTVILHYGAYANVIDTAADTSNIDLRYRNIVVLWASQAILRAKLPSLAGIGAALLAALDTREKQETARLGIESKSVLENLVK